MEYDPLWPRRAERLTSLLAEVLTPASPRIEHIGSTSIVNMAAKNVIDLQASVEDLEAATVGFERPLDTLGFRLSPHRFDHVPAGLHDDPTTWEKRLWTRRSHPDGDVNLHVRRVGSPNERLALLFRDWFLLHPDAVPSYAAFKMRLATIATDIDVYADVKDPVVDLVMAVAEPWANEQHWRP